MRPEPALDFLVIDDFQAAAHTHERALVRVGRVQISLTKEDGEAQLASPAGRWSGVILDLKIPGVDDLELLELLRRHDEQVPVMVVTGWAATDRCINSIQALGATLAKKPLVEENYTRFIDEARAYETRRRVPGDVAATLSERWGLSDKRGTVLRLLLAGCSREEIAIEMGVCVETVRDHVRAILAASGAKDSRALMALALRTGTGDRVA